MAPHQNSADAAGRAIRLIYRGVCRNRLSLAGLYAQSIAASLPDEPMDTVSERLQEQTNNFVLNAIMRLQCRPSFLAPAA